MNLRQRPGAISVAAWAERKRGQWMGFVLCLVIVIAAGALALADREVVAGLLGISGLAGVLRIFVPPPASVD